MTKAEKRVVILESRVALLERAVAFFVARDLQIRGHRILPDIADAIHGARCRLDFEDIDGVIDLSVLLVDE